MKSEEEILKSIYEWKKNKLYQDIVNNNRKISFCEENEILLQEIINDIITRKNERELLMFTCNVLGFSLDDLIDKVIKTQDIMFMYKFARDVKDAPVKRFSDIVIASKNSSYIYLFAKDVSGAPVEELANAMIEIQDIDHIYYFVRDVKNAPIEKMMDEVIRVYDIEKIKWLAKRLGLTLKEFYHMYSREKYFATEIVMENRNKEEILAGLINNMDQKDNLIKLRIYFDFLNNLESSLDEARSCDMEYKEYLMKQKKSDNKSLKKTTDN